MSDHTDVARLWRVFTKTRCPDAREQLILQYRPLVNFTAARLRAGMPGLVDYDDLVAYGMIGLIEAVDRFDARPDVKFETYAFPRIRGAMLDEMRALDWVPRSVRARQRLIDQTTSQLRADNLREPTRAELARAIGCDIDELRRGAPLGLVALEDLVSIGRGEQGEYVTVLDSLLDESAPDPGADVEHDEIRRVLVAAMSELTDREYAMLWLYYFSGRTLSHIGGHFGVTESRVSQIHAKALRALASSERIRAFGDAYGWTAPAAEAEQVA